MIKNNIRRREGWNSQRLISLSTVLQTSAPMPAGRGVGKHFQKPTRYMVETVCIFENKQIIDEIAVSTV